MIGLLLSLFTVEAADIGDTAPDFKLMTVSGESISLSDYRGKTVVLEWFNPGCPFVKYAHGEGRMKVLASKWRAKDIVWLAVNSGGAGKQGAAPEDNTAAISDWSISYPIAMDPTGEVGQLYSAKTTPQMYIVNTEGLLVYQGALDNAPMGRKSGDYVSYVSDALTSLRNGTPIEVPETKPYGCSVKYK